VTQDHTGEETVQVPKTKEAKQETETPTSMAVDPQPPPAGTLAQYSDHMTVWVRGADIVVGFWQIDSQTPAAGSTAIAAHYLGRYIIGRQVAEQFAKVLADALGRDLVPRET
jgi:hypothetical protein